MSATCTRINLPLTPKIFYFSFSFFLSARTHGYIRTVISWFRSMSTFSSPNYQVFPTLAFPSVFLAFILSARSTQYRFTLNFLITDEITLTISLIMEQFSRIPSAFSCAACRIHTYLFLPLPFLIPPSPSPLPHANCFFVLTQSCSVPSLSHLD